MNKQIRTKPAIPPLEVGARIASEDSGKAIYAAESDNADYTGYVARVFYRESQKEWVASSIDSKKGMIVFISKTPAPGQKLLIKKLGKNKKFAMAMLV